MAVAVQGMGTFEVTIERAGGWCRQLARGLPAAEAEALARRVAAEEAVETGDDIDRLTANTLAASGSLISWVEEQTWGDCLGCVKPVVDACGPWSFLWDAAGEERSVHLECRETALKQMAEAALEVESTVECSEGHNRCWRGGRAVWDGRSWQVTWACDHEQIDWLLARAMDGIWGRAWANVAATAAA